jgi:AraC-like DNA-binding protein
MSLVRPYLLSGENPESIPLRILADDVPMGIMLNDFIIQKPESYFFPGGAAYARWDYSVRGAIKIRGKYLPQGCCQLIHPVTGKVSVDFPVSGNYRLLSFFLSPKMLATVGQSFYIMKSLLATVARGEVAGLSGLPLTAGLTLLAAVTELLADLDKGEIPESRLSARVEYIMHLYLQQVTLYEILTAQEKIPAYDEGRICQLGEYILQHLARPFCLKDLAARAGVNESRLKKEFKRVYGSTIFVFISQSRIRLAKEMLDTTSLSVHAIAGEVGFSSPAHFSKAFKKQFGVPPGQLRAKRIA